MSNDTIIRQKTPHKKPKYNDLHGRRNQPLDVVVPAEPTLEVVIPLGFEDRSQGILKGILILIFKLILV